MKLMPCPLNGLRNISEFIYGGEVLEPPNQSQCSDREWLEYLFMQNNAKGVVFEWWFHSPTAYWFIAERNTATDEILNTFTYEQFCNHF